MKRLMDVFLGSLALLITSPLFILISIVISATSRGGVIYWSDRVGKDNLIFKMPKFRTMMIDTPPVASSALDEPSRWLTPVGGFLRRNSLDELPQLWSVIKGDMSLVGPRPVLAKEDELLSLRTKWGVHTLRPGITGLAQIRGRDFVSITKKAKIDLEYLQTKSHFIDLKIIVITLVKVFKREGISH